MYDVIIVGGGPAGLSAALILARCRRNVFLCDDGRPRNAATKAVHGFLTRDGMNPYALRKTAREQMAEYPNVEIRDVKIIDAFRTPDGAFIAVPATGEAVTARALLLATGVIDELPDIPGFDRFYGVSIHHCPYCDGWEKRDQPLAVYGDPPSVCKMALKLRLWSKDLAIFTNGEAVDQDQCAEMQKWRIPVYTEKIDRLEGSGQALERLVLQSGEAIARKALFFSTGQIKRQLLAEKLGCEFTPKGAIATNLDGQSRIDGVFCAGDNTEAPQLVAVAVSEGAKAAVAINAALVSQDLQKGPPD